MHGRFDTTEETRISLRLNGELRELVVDPFASLAHTLRERAGLTGTKVGCDAGDCGACTILMNGEQVCACLVATGQAQGAEIVTVEGRSANAWLARLQDAFLTHGAAQCGICTPGMLMAAADLLARDADPSHEKINDALGGILCRCTGYQKIVEAVASVARPAATATLPAPADGAVGARLARVDGRPKVEGADLFGADSAPADALWLRCIRSPHAHARFSFGDFDAFVKQHPGLVAVLTYADVPGHNGYGIFPHLRHQAVFAEGYARYRGDAILALVGERAAVEATDPATLPIDWQPLAALDTIAAATSPGAAQLHAEAPGNILTSGYLEKGAAREVAAEAAVQAEGHFTTSFVEHGYIEPEAGYARTTGTGHERRVEVVASTQAPYMDREEVACVLGIAPERVRIVPTACGGGFGGKLDVLVQPMLAVAAWKLGRPVRTVLSRVESMAASTKRHPARIWARASADKNGALVSYESDADFDTGAYASWGPTVAGRVPVHATGPYLVPNVVNRSRAIYTNQNPSGAFRGFGVPQAAIAHETLMDDLAARLGIDRLAIRHRNAIRIGDATATGQVLQHSAGLAQCLDALKDDWHTMLAEAAAHNTSGKHTRRGAGIGCMWYGCGNTSMSNPSKMRVTLSRDGRLTLFNGAVDIGQGSTTVILQICADALGLPPGAFRLVLGDTDLTEDAGKTSASRQTFVSGKAAQLAGADLRRKILSMANAGTGARLELAGTTIRVSDGEVRRSIDLGALEADGEGHVLKGHGTYDPPTTMLDEKGQGIPYATYGFAAQICLLDVDLDFGKVKLHRIVAAHDVGRAINPTLVEGQIHGGIAQGIGLALLEEFLPGRTENLHDYLIPTFGDMPQIDIKIIEDHEHHGPYGAKGIGEPALVPTAPAILGAIRHATGLRLTQVPALPHRVWQALRDQESRA